jgi:hypothetical protein
MRKWMRIVYFKFGRNLKSQKDYGFGTDQIDDGIVVRKQYRKQTSLTKARTE